MKVVVNGVAIESTSVADVLTLVKALQKKKVQDPEVKRTMVLWGKKEINYLVQNIKKPLAFVVANFPNKARKASAITAKYYAVKTKNVDKMGGRTARTVIKNDLIKNEKMV